MTAPSGQDGSPEKLSLSSDRPPRPLTLTPRVAAIALVVQALLWRWETSTTGLSLQLGAAILLSIAALGLAVLGSLS